MKLPEKVAYLKGLMDGMKIDEKSDSGRLFTAISEILEDVALQIEDLQDQVDEVVESVDDIDGDLADISEFIFGDDFEDDDAEDDDLSDDDLFPPVLDYDGIGEEIFDEEDEDDEDSELSDIEPFEDDEEESDTDSIESLDTDAFIDEDDEDILLDAEELYEVICPTCKDKIHLTEAMLATGSIDCPGCGEHLEFDMSDE
jgi:hypothetical protein